MKTLRFRARPVNIKSMSVKSFLTRRCVNLRHDAKDDILKPIARPRLLVDEPALPFFSFKEDGDIHALFYRDGAYCHAVLNCETPRLTEIFQSDDPPRCCLLVDNVLEIHTQNGRIFTLRRDAAGNFTYISPAEYPSVTFVADEQMILRADIDSGKLSEDYSLHSGSLNNSDSADFSKALKASYLRLSDMAQRGDLLVQPVWLRYRLLDGKGNTRHRSSPVLIGPNGGFQCCSMQSAEMLSGVVRPKSSLSANVSHLEAVVPSFADTDVTTIVIESSLPLCPFDFSLPIDTSVIRSGNNTVLRYFLPGVSAGMVEMPAVARELADTVCRCGDAAFSEICRLSAGETGRILLPLKKTFSTEQQLRMLASLIAASPDKETTESSFGRPFTAGAACLIGDNVIYGDISFGAERYDYAIMICPKNNRFYSTHLISCNIGRIVEIVEMHGRDTLLGSTSALLYLFGTAGIAVATVSADGTLKNINIVSRHGLELKQQITSLNSDRYQLAVIAGGTLSLIEKSKITAVAGKLPKLASIAHDSEQKELWLGAVDGTLMVTDMDFKHYSTVEPSDFESICDCCGMPLLLREAAIFTPFDSSVSPLQPVNCRLTIDMEAPPASSQMSEWPALPMRLTAEVSGQTKGTIALRSSNVPLMAQTDTDTVCEISGDGRFNAPVGVDIVGPRRRYYRLEIAQTATSEDFSIGRIEVTFE